MQHRISVMADSMGRGPLMEFLESISGIDIAFDNPSAQSNLALDPGAVSLLVAGFGSVNALIAGIATVMAARAGHRSSSPPSPQSSVGTVHIETDDDEILVPVRGDGSIAVSKELLPARLVDVDRIYLRFGT